MSSVSSTSDTLFLLDNKTDLQDHLVNMLQQGRKDVAIFSHSLDPTLFNDEALNSAISTIARSSPSSCIRIAIEEPQALVDANHKLLTLSQRLVSKIKIQKITVEPQDPYQFMIVDQDKLWLQHSKDSFTGFANYDARPEVKRFISIFNDLWKNSESDARLRKLLI